MRHAATLLIAVGFTLTLTEYAVADRPDDLLLVAHRGVVTEDITVNSLEALTETIRRDYSHIEVDLRVTKDGHAVCLHDRSLKRTTGIDKDIYDVTLRELRELVPANTVPSFETFCDFAAGRIDLMPDVKECPPELRDAFTASIGDTMRKYNLMENALFIGNRAVGSAFQGEARIAYRGDLETLRNSGLVKNDIAKEFFIFGHAVDFTPERVEAFQDAGLEVIVSINLFHYRDGDQVQQGLDDVVKMRSYGVDGLQIDAVYDEIFLNN